MSLWDDKKFNFRVTYLYEDGSDLVETKTYFDGEDEWGNPWKATPQNVKKLILKEKRKIEESLEQHIDAINNDGGKFVKVNQVRDIKVELIDI